MKPRAIVTTGVGAARSESSSSFSPEGSITREKKMKLQHAAKTIEPARIEERGQLTIAGLGGTFTAETREGIPALWKRFGPYLGKVPGQVGDAAYGVSNMQRGEINYIAGVEVLENADLPPDFSEARVNARTYAVFEHRGHVSTIPQTVGEIGRDWLPHSGWEPAEGFHIIERYGREFDPRTSSGLTEILIPLKS
jgi:AraC family transcriptional regulator